MHPFFHYLHDQVIGFFKVEKDVSEAQSTVDRGASKGFASLLVALGIALAVAPLFLNFLSGHVALRCLMVSIVVFGVAMKYWRGGSVFHLIRGLARNWVPLLLLIYMYFTIGKMAIVVLKEDQSPDYAIHGGIMMMAGAFLGVVTSLVHAHNLKEAATPHVKTVRAAVFGFRLYALIGTAFFLGGFVMLAWGTGWAEWFVVDVLGW